MSELFKLYEHDDTGKGNGKGNDKGKDTIRRKQFYIYKQPEKQTNACPLAYIQLFGHIESQYKITENKLQKEFKTCGKNFEYNSDTGDPTKWEPVIDTNYLQVLNTKLFDKNHVLIKTEFEYVYTENNVKYKITFGDNNKIIQTNLYSKTERELRVSSDNSSVEQYIRRRMIFNIAPVHITQSNYLKFIKLFESTVRSDISAIKPTILKGSIYGQMIVKLASIISFYSYGVNIEYDIENSGIYIKVLHTLLTLQNGAERRYPHAKLVLHGSTYDTFASFIEDSRGFNQSMSNDGKYGHGIYLSFTSHVAEYYNRCKQPNTAILSLILSPTEMLAADTGSTCFFHHGHSAYVTDFGNDCDNYNDACLTRGTDVLIPLGFVSTNKKL